MKYLSALICAVVALTPSCSASRKHEDSLTVFAASSLTSSFATLGRAFEKAHPGVRVTFSFAASNALGQQLLAAAPADDPVRSDADVLPARRDARRRRQADAVDGADPLVEELRPAERADVHRQARSGVDEDVGDAPARRDRCVDPRPRRGAVVGEERVVGVGDP